MTECGWISTFPYPEADLTGSVGRPLRHFDVKYARTFQLRGFPLTLPLGLSMIASTRYAIRPSVERSGSKAHPS